MNKLVPATSLASIGRCIDFEITIHLPMHLCRLTKQSIAPDSVEYSHWSTTAVEKRKNNDM